MTPRTPLDRVNRIAPVDGLRAVAVLGVFWAHVWSFGCGGPALRLPIINLDVNRVVSMLGTGVDLFFVISGFCMYLMYARKQSKFSAREYGKFLVNRWRRIAPAFYVAIAGSAAIAFFGRGELLVKEVAANLCFGQLWIGSGKLNPVFWSLATEWHFYLVLPLVIWATSRYGFGRTVTAFAGISVASRIVQAFWLTDAASTNIPFRLVEFIWGVVVARFYTTKTLPPRVLRGSFGVLLGLAITYSGRLLMWTPVVVAARQWGPLCQAFSTPLLTLGYAIILWNVVSCDSGVARALSLPAIRSVGRWSYSIYLWHWYPSLWVASLCVEKFGTGALMPYFATAIGLVVVLPLAAMSYALFEKPYFTAHSANTTASAIQPFSATIQ